MAQNQKTEPFKADDLQDLTVEEDRMVELYFAGKNQSEAYLEAYSATGYSQASLKVRACRKFAEAHIQSHIRVLRANGLANSALTLEQRIKDEQAFAQRAEDAGNFGAAGGAQDRINKLMGMYVDKIQDVTRENDIMGTLKEIATISPDLARQMALANGIEWSADQGTTKH